MSQEQVNKRSELAGKILNNKELFYIIYMLDEESFEEYINSRS